MALFCIAIDPVLKEFENKGFLVSAYADDIVIASDSSPDLNTACNIIA